jgi:hypothetical protein
VVNLFIPEPLPAEAELPPGKRGLVYPVVVSLAVQDSSEVLPPPPTHGPDQRHWRRCRRPRSPQPTSSGVAPGSPKSNPQGPPHSLGMTRPTVTHTAPPVATAPVQEVDTAGNVMMAPPFPKTPYLFLTSRPWKIWTGRSLLEILRPPLPRKLRHAHPLLPSPRLMELPAGSRGRSWAEGKNLMGFHNRPHLILSWAPEQPTSSSAHATRLPIRVSPAARDAEP